MATDLKLLLAKLKEKTSGEIIAAPGSVALPENCALFLGTPDDEVHLPRIKHMFQGAPAYWNLSAVSTLMELEIYCKRRNITRIVSTQTRVLRALLNKMGKLIEEPSLDSYAGSMFTFGTPEIEIVFIPPLQHLVTVPYARELISRFISKIIQPRLWAEPSEFQWKMLEPEGYQEAYDWLASSELIGIDIETVKKNLAIRCISFTGLKFQNGRRITWSYVLVLDSMWAVSAMRNLCALPVPKVFQNGKYDNLYLLRYSSPVAQWYFDTAHQFHALFAELPKDLGFLNAFFLRKVIYWKDLADTQDLKQYYRYNALDSWATVNVCIEWMRQAPAWAKRNYILEFPLVFPCLLAEATGILRDMERLHTARKVADKQVDSQLASLQRMLRAPNFNPASPKQVGLLLKLLGCGDITSTGDKELSKAAFRHPLIGRIIEKLKAIRKANKLISNYFRTDEDAKQTGIHAGEGGAKEYKGMILYSINPHGTGTGRNSSKESAFWCGLQIQNVPRGPLVKQTLRAPEGWHIGECDLEQAESRDTAHIVGDEGMIESVTGERDFHSVNASAFFGVPYEAIFDQALGKAIDKNLRDLAKRVNHGANYNMGIFVLLETMGLEAIFRAAKILNLPFSAPEEIAEYLLVVFHLKYIKLKGMTKFRSAKVMRYVGIQVNPEYKLCAPGTYYHAVTTEISNTGMLVSRAYHHTEYNATHHPDVLRYIAEGDWTRRCFEDPSASKTALNSYVAHPPQSLNARTLNEAFLRVFTEVALPNPTTFRLLAQIHDSILFCYKAGYEHHAEAVKRCMEIPVTVRDISGTYRTFTVPAALKLGLKDKATGEFKRAVYWSETE